MAVTVTKTVPVAESSKFSKALVAGEEKTIVQAKVDEFLLIHKALLESSAFELIKKYDELKKTLQSIASEEGKDMSSAYTFSSQYGEVTFKAASMRTEVTNKAKMIEVLGDATFASVANVSMVDLKKYCSFSELQGFTTQVPGSRMIGSVVLK